MKNTGKVRVTKVRDRNGRVAGYQVEDKEGRVAAVARPETVKGRGRIGG